LFVEASRVKVIKFIVGGFLAHEKFLRKLQDISTPLFRFIRTASHCGRNVVIYTDGKIAVTVPYDGGIMIDRISLESVRTNLVMYL